MTLAVSLAGIASNATSFNTVTLTSGTSVASTSGTSVLLSGIPSGVKRVTLMLNGVTNAGNSFLVAQLGAGSVQTTGYVTSVGGVYGGTAASNSAPGTNGAYIMNYATGTPIYGHVMCTVFSGNTWLVSSTLGGSNRMSVGTGIVTLSGSLDRINVIESTGGAFSAGSINIIYE